jgi:hypothetical protein
MLKYCGICGCSASRSAQLARLLERAVDEKVRRDDFQSAIVTHPLGFLIEHLRESARPRKVSFRIFAAGDLVLAIEERGHFLIGTRQLAHDVRAHNLAIREGRRAGEGFPAEIRLCRNWHGRGP